jgi:hypothetical protein
MQRPTASVMSALNSSDSGPTGFVESVADWLVALGHSAASVKTERFGGQ